MKTTSFRALVDNEAITIGDGYRAKNNELGGKGLVFLRSAYLQARGFVLDRPDRFITHDAAAFGPKISRLGDVVVTTKGNSAGRVGRITENESGCVYSPHLSYWRVIDSRRLNENYLYYWSMSEEFLNQMRGMVHSTDMAPYLSLRDQLQLKISLPEIDTQSAIGMVLSALDDKIDLNRRMNETLEAMARAIFKDWFVDFGPVRAKAEGRIPPGLSPDIAALFPDALDDEDKPVGWSFEPFGNVCELNPSERLGKGENTPYLDMSALPTFGSCHDAPIQRIFSSGSKFRDSDTLLARITPCLENGKTAYVRGLGDDVVGWGSTEFIVIRPQPPFPPEYGYLLARNAIFRDHAIRSMTGTSGRQRVQTDQLANFEVAVPSPEILGAFGAFVRPWFDVIGANAEENQTLAALRDLLLPKLMSGEIRIRDAEKAVGEAT